MQLRLEGKILASNNILKDSSDCSEIYSKTQYCPPRSLMDAPEILLLPLSFSDRWRLGAQKLGHWGAPNHNFGLFLRFVLYLKIY